MSSDTPPFSELDGILASLNDLKAPGANKSKIASITNIAVKYIDKETIIVQSFYRALKRAPSTHKLGALYVIDSVIRQWTDKAKKAGQDAHSAKKREEGTYATAIKRVGELMPALLQDTLKEIPAAQKPKLANLVDIWDRGQFFPSKTIADFKVKLAENQETQSSGPGQFRPALPTRPSMTPLGYPPQSLYDRGLIKGKPQTNTVAQQQNGVQQTAAAAAPESNVNSILAALAASAASKQAAVPQQPPPQVPALPVPLPANGQQGIPQHVLQMFGQANLGGQTAQNNAPPPFTAPPPFNIQGFPGFPQQAAPIIQQAPAPVDPLASLRGLLPENILNDPSKLIPALHLLQDLQKDGIPMQQWEPIIRAFHDQANDQPAQQGNQRNGRGRSRSPVRDSRGSPVYGNYESPGQQERSRYRQRSPIRNNVVSQPGIAWNGKPMQPKIIRTDQNLPQNSIKVLSRTLFVGGANGSEQELERLFSRYGQVQTCIANRDKRHAFVKMTTRESALAAKSGTEVLQASNDREAMAVARQTKWGVGFGPRECCDYANGESIIPINKLTEADVKWLLTAEYGGTGGQQIQSGMVLEEPDIEIGAGVSSKAMSRRLGPGQEAGGEKKGRQGRGGRFPDRQHQGGRNDMMVGNGYGQEPVARPEPVAEPTPPAVPGFGFQLPGTGH